ncbi:HsdM family class I SAM-dependent methyltransferase [Synoicihabitans lomoniglobus]|uniref:site-specific DNA-methyltransferase (adenine-specific) n=1 Tax=Synoicihabitans lomoniglobus TaxID=2909285 RepID=A0AAE9ZTW1_9BACT|nr:type I restriction-modification system subunit M [Opitutaceae bacterium LMO-M01]WED64186.1 class I SAM-dependent DNA methyltransferase [Opitutaceae bacterium LMO-M01]
MTASRSFETQAKTLIDDLKAVCANHGLGNDGNEFKIITQIFLYKFLNDKFAYEAKRIDPKLGKAKSWEDALRAYSADDYEMLLAQLGGSTAQLRPEHFLATLYGRQNEDGFAKILDTTLLDIAALNTDVFSVTTDDKTKVVLFDAITDYVSSKRNEFARALINKLMGFSFEQIFAEKFDFFATLFEYLIKDYNKDGGGKYAEYYTPHAVAKIMAACLMTQERQSVSCYDPSAGSGTLLMNLAHKIGEEKCALYSQDISQKSSGLLRLNLILNNLVHSIPNIVQGNTILHPEHRENGALKKFDYIVSNPPFKLDFSDFRSDLETKANHQRFFAGIPKVPTKKKDSMAIYLLFLQHIIHSLSEHGKAAVVVPTGFITAQSGIDKKIRQHLVENKMLGGVVSMPSNIFATTGTNVSILFLDASNDGDVILVDASKLGTKVKDGKNQKTVLSTEEEDKIIQAFKAKKTVEDLAVAVAYDEIASKNYSLSAGQYFEVQVEYTDISSAQFKQQLTAHRSRLHDLFSSARKLESEIEKTLSEIRL